MSTDFSSKSMSPATTSTSSEISTVLKLLLIIPSVTKEIAKFTSKWGQSSPSLLPNTRVLRQLSSSVCVIWWKFHICNSLEHKLEVFYCAKCVLGWGAAVIDDIADWKVVCGSPSFVIFVLKSMLYKNFKTKNLLYKVYSSFLRTFLIGISDQINVGKERSLVDDFPPNIENLFLSNSGQQRFWNPNELFRSLFSNLILK